MVPSFHATLPTYIYTVVNVDGAAAKRWRFVRSLS